MKPIEKRVQPQRHKSTIDKYFGQEGKLERQNRRHNQLKSQDTVEGDKPKHPRKGDDDGLENGDNVCIRKLEDFFDRNPDGNLVNISRTTRGLAITRPEYGQTKAAAAMYAANVPGAPHQRSRIEVLDHVNSLLVGPDDRLYNMLSQEGFRDLMKAEESMQERAKQKPISCNCKKTHCLKMYCECISKNLYCNSECQCKDCYNNSVHESQRQKSKDKIGRKGPSGKQSFLDHDEYPAQKSCNCKKSGCNKKYCQCFGAGNKCSAACKCTSCKNKVLPEGKPDPPVQEYEDRPVTFNMMHLAEAEMYGGTGAGNASNGFSQLGYDSMRPRSEFALGEASQHPSSYKVYSFAGVNQGTESPSTKPPQPKQ